jgi:flagellar biosynthesis repressor protein FlbT
MIIHLKKNERVFINGAVIQLDRRGSIELLNDAQFLLASHVMQIEEATTPLRQLYFVVQTMLIDPVNSELTRELFTIQIDQLNIVVQWQSYRALLGVVGKLVEKTEYFEALKLLRKNFEIDAMIGTNVLEQSGIQKKHADEAKVA